VHPLFARYLNLDAALDTLRRESLGQPLKAEERAFASAARAAAEEAAVLSQADAGASPSPELQKALIIIAARAASLALRDSSELAPLVEKARAALEAEGATEDQIEQFLAALLVEEAFGYDDDGDDFDVRFFTETLKGVPALASLTSERVDGLIDGFTKTAPAGWEKAYEVAATALFESAWGDGPEPINGEHVEAALERAQALAATSEHAKLPEALRRLIESLEGDGLVGPERKKRLTQRLVGEDVASGAVH
jgi:hypothetical protein